MKFTKALRYFPPFILLIAFLFTLSSCLPDDNNANSRSQVRVGLTLENVNSAIAAGSDSLEISTLKFVHGASYFLNEGDTLLFNESPEIIIHESTQNNTKLLADGVFQEGSLTDVRFSIEQAPSSVQNIDPDFVEGDTLYSMIIEGTYQDSAFTFKSTQDFSASFSLSPPPEASSNSLFEVLLATDVSSWFLSEGSVINPRDTTSTAAINTNIDGSFRLEGVQQSGN